MATGDNGEKGAVESRVELIQVTSTLNPRGQSRPPNSPPITFHYYSTLILSLLLRLSTRASILGFNHVNNHPDPDGHTQNVR